MHRNRPARTTEEGFLLRNVLPVALIAHVGLFMCSTLSWAESKTRIEEEPRDPALQSVAELDAFLRLNRADLLPALPPDADFSLRQPATPEVVPFAWKNFPPEFLKHLADRVIYEYGAPVYPLRAIEDPKTRAQHLFDCRGQWICSLPPPFGYDPHAPLKAAFPQLGIASSSTGRRAYEALFDPSRIELHITLLPSEYLEPYLAEREQIVQATETRNSEPETQARLLEPATKPEMGSIEPEAGRMVLEIWLPDAYTNRGGHRLAGSALGLGAPVAQRQCDRRRACVGRDRRRMGQRAPDGHPLGAGLRLNHRESDPSDVPGVLLDHRPSARRIPDPGFRGRKR